MTKFSQITYTSDCIYADRMSGAQCISCMQRYKAEKTNLSASARLAITATRVDGSTLNEPAQLRGQLAEYVFVGVGQKKKKKKEKKKKEQKKEKKEQNVKRLATTDRQICQVQLH